MTEKPKKAKRRRAGQPAPVWKKFMIEADRRIVAAGGYTKLVGNSSGTVTGDGMNSAIAAEIMRHGDGPAFLKAVRRGRSTQRQNLRYQLLREVERLSGDAVPRRRPDANTPDAQALRGTVRLELEAYAEAGRTPAAAVPVVHQGGKIKRLVSMIAGKFRRAGRGTGI